MRVLSPLPLLLLVPSLLTAQTGDLPAPPPDTLATACSAPEPRQFDFWLGRWRVTGPDGRLAGVNEITRVAQGCALQERYHSAGGYTGTSLNWYDRAAGTWHQLWVDNSGLRLELSGGLDGEGRMVLAGDRTARDGTPVRDRITWTARGDGTVLQVWDLSRDGGGTWENLFTGTYTRLPDEETT